MSIEELHAQAKCCISEKPLSTSQHLNAIQVHKKANWKYPVWGNFLTGEEGMAMAFVHDDCMTNDGQLIGEVKYVIEVNQDKIVYHLISELQ